MTCKESKYRSRCFCSPPLTRGAIASSPNALVEGDQGEDGFFLKPCSFHLLCLWYFDHNSCVSLFSNCGILFHYLPTGKSIAIGVPVPSLFDVFFFGSLAALGLSDFSLCLKHSNGPISSFIDERNSSLGNDGKRRLIPPKLTFHPYHFPHNQYAVCFTWTCKFFSFSSSSSSSSSYAHAQ